MRSMPISSISSLILLSGESICESVCNGSVVERCDKGLSLKKSAALFLLCVPCFGREIGWKANLAVQPLALL